MPEEVQQRNAMEQVPVLEFTETATGNTIVLTQSLAIMEFLEEWQPQTPLFPRNDLLLRARVRQVGNDLYMYIV